ncbi:G1 family glutamic endopeptidase [Leifsonia shinshuensis]|uniref:G1 family glutamic endopeptidase n=1 Tax=Leifsonia shinshuensis TaxID=150026 RepID=UPI0028594B62|nr:G1 family glutamic endopeptidase [Leifsonia shinshuensis]MDR6972920.1 hypothetical protein [Leifsonia shinshuensis]
MKRTLGSVASLAGGLTLALALSLAAAPANAADSPTVSNHTETGCGQPITLHTPAREGQALSGTDVGLSTDTPLFKEAAARHVHWLSTITCKAHARPHPTLEPASAGAQTLNWSGYVTTTGFTPNYVQAAWTEPSVSLPSGTNSAESVIWPGLGGYCDQCQLIQDGTLQFDQASGSSYLQQDYFWFEVFPQEQMQLVTNLIPNPGDSLATTVSWSNSTASFALCDYTQNTCLTGTQSSPAPTGSAEWVVERPTLASGGYPALPNFGNVTISQAAFQLTPNGQLAYTAGSSNAFPVTMVNTANQTLAAPGSLSSDGASFSDQWYRLG